MKNYFTISVLYIFLIILPNCSDRENVNPGLTGKTFNYLFFDTEQECEASQTGDFFINCHQQLVFIDEERAEIIITDIINPVKYAFIDHRIVIFSNSMSEFSSNIVFEIIDRSTLKRVDNGTLWKEQVGNSIWDQ